MATKKSGSSGSKSSRSSSSRSSGGASSGMKKSAKKSAGKTAKKTATSSSSSRSSRSPAKTSKTSKKSSGGRAGGSRGGGGKLSRTTVDHDEIRQWAEARGAKPSCVRGTGGGGDTGMLRLDFPGFSGEGKLQEITWDEFFEQFDQQGLALVYQEKTKDGQPSNFNKLVSRDDR